MSFLLGYALPIFIQITAENYDEVINELANVVESADFPGEQNEENLDVITEVLQASAQLVTMDPTIVNPEVRCHYSTHLAHVIMKVLYILYVVGQPVPIS